MAGGTRERISLSLGVAWQREEGQQRSLTAASSILEMKKEARQSRQKWWRSGQLARERKESGSQSSQQMPQAAWVEELQEGVDEAVEEEEIEEEEEEEEGSEMESNP